MDFFTYKKPALIVVDMQIGFLEEGQAMCVPDAMTDVVPNVKLLLEFFRKKGWPIIFSEFVYSNHCPCLNGKLFPCEKDIPDGGERCCFEGDRSVNTIEALKPLDSEVLLQKYGYDTFFGTSLDYILRTQEITTLIIPGVTTDCCVFSTVCGGFHHEYECVVPSDGTAAMTTTKRDVILDIIDKCYGKVYSTKDIISRLDSVVVP